MDGCPLLLSILRYIWKMLPTLLREEIVTLSLYESSFELMLRELIFLWVLLNFPSFRVSIYNT